MQQWSSRGLHSEHSQNVNQQLELIVILFIWRCRHRIHGNGMFVCTHLIATTTAVCGTWKSSRPTAASVCGTWWLGLAWACNNLQNWGRRHHCCAKLWRWNSCFKFPAKSTNVKLWGLWLICCSPYKSLKSSCPNMLNCSLICRG